MCVLSLDVCTLVLGKILQLDDEKARSQHQHIIPSLLLPSSSLYPRSLRHPTHIRSHIKSPQRVRRVRAVIACGSVDLAIKHPRSKGVPRRVGDTRLELNPRLAVCRGPSIIVIASGRVGAG